MIAMAAGRAPVRRLKEASRDCRGEIFRRRFQKKRKEGCFQKN